MSRHVTAPGRFVGPAIAGGAALVVVVLLLLVWTGRDRALRPDQSAVPIPDGAVVRFGTEDCRDADGGRPVCQVTLAVGPLDGIDLPRPAEELLAEHLVANGWRRADGVLVAPQTTASARVAAFEQAPAPLRARIADEVDDHVATRDLAVLWLLPGGTPGTPGPR